MPLTCKDVACLGQCPRGPGGTFLVRNRSGLYPRLAVDGQGKKVVSGAGGVLLTRTANTVGLDRALGAALAPWRRPTARHDPGKVVLDLAISLVIGGDCLADIGQLRGARGGVRPGSLRSDGVPADRHPCVDATAALAAMHGARARARALAGEHA